MVEELERLIAEQVADDAQRCIQPEFRDMQVPLEVVVDYLTTDENGEIISFEPRPPRGTILNAPALYHGTYAGYTRHSCRCVPCTRANAQYRRQYRRNNKVAK